MKKLLDARNRGMLMKRAVDLLRRKAGIDYRKSYAQCGEDVIARTVFDMLKIARPTYLDVGAHHPTFLSNTFLFYEQGSRGVTVEPDPELHSRFLDKRSGDTNLNIGIGPQPGGFELFIMSTRTLNTLSEEEARLYVSQGYRIEKRHRVEVVTINDVMTEHFGGAPDFLSVDVEGLDYEILASLDFSRFRPKVICVETIVFSSTGKGEKRTEIDTLLCKRGYVRFADTYINTLYVDEQSWVNR
ncbi:FkbM family methyltransferase [Methyloversatilis sp.]|uniref:FkbM family methyltransferase n=1 Tax=Methyloversatilis sp. TaxID=2569862 RepID=UPI003D2E4937